MFSGNGKISARQMYRSAVIGLFSLGALLIPPAADRDGIVSVLIALILLGVCMAATTCAEAPRSRFVKGICYAHCWALGTMAAHLTGRLIQEFLLTGTSLWLILVWFYGFCFYNLYKGLECRLRVSEILFGFFLLLILLVTLLTLGELEPERCLELQIVLEGGQLRDGYRLFAWLSAALSLWYLRGSVDGKVSYKKTVGAVWLTGACAILLWYLYTYSMYGAAGHTGLPFPLASAMTLAHFPGNVIGRLDTLFVFGWVIGLFLLCSDLFAPWTSTEPDTRQRFLLAALLAASLALAIQEDCVQWCEQFVLLVSTPLLLILLLFYCLRKRGKPALALLLLPVLLLTGCGEQELEKRSLVTAIGVDAGEDDALLITFGFGSSAEEEGEEPFGTEARSIREAEEAYGERMQKEMDFNHLKCLYLSLDLLQSGSAAGILEEIQTDGTYSRGILLYATEGSASEAAEKETQPDEGLPVHQALNAWYNGETCQIPMVTEDGRYNGAVSWP